MKLILIRHCETDWNAAGRMQGHTDTILNDRGRTQAIDLADKLATLGISRIFTSDLKRALQTAQLISLRLGVPVKADPRLRECHFGELEGLTPAEASALYRHPHFYPITYGFYTSEREPYDFTALGGESKSSVMKRHLDFLGDLSSGGGSAFGGKKKHSNETVLTVGHGTGLNTLLAALGQEPSLQRGELRFLEV
jgi:broad specificity phosphatase PhoE